MSWKCENWKEERNNENQVTFYHRLFTGIFILRIPKTECVAFFHSSEIGVFFFHLLLSNHSKLCKFVSISWYHCPFVIPLSWKVYDFLFVSSTKSCSSFSFLTRHSCVVFMFIFKNQNLSKTLWQKLKSNFVVLTPKWRFFLRLLSYTNLFALYSASFFELCSFHFISVHFFNIFTRGATINFMPILFFGGEMGLSGQRNSARACGCHDNTQFNFFFLSLVTIQN